MSRQSRGLKMPREDSLIKGTDTQTILRRSLVIFVSLAMLATPMPSHALAPQSRFSQDEKKPAAVAIQATPEEQFLEFLQAMRTRLAQLNQAQGMHAFGFVVERKRGLVTILGAGEGSPKAIAIIPDYAMQFMRAYGLEELRLPLNGLYAPKLQQALANTGQKRPALMRWIPEMSRRGFLSAMAMTARNLYFGDAPSPGSVLLGLEHNLVIPQELIYANKPLARMDVILREFAMDNILGVHAQLLTPNANIEDDPMAMEYERMLKDMSESLQENSGLLWDKYKRIESEQRVRIEEMEVTDLMRKVLNLGIADLEWLRSVRDAITISSLPLVHRRLMLLAFNRICPEMAMSEGILNLGRAVVLGPTSGMERRMRMDQEGRDLDYLEYEALQITGSPGEEPFLGAFLTAEYRVHRMMDLLAQFYEIGQWPWKDNPANHDVMHEMLPLTIRARGGISARGMSQLRRITGIYRKAMKQMAERGETATQDNCRQIVERLDQTMREAPLKLEADQEEKGEGIGESQEYTILDNQGRTFEEIYNRHLSADIFRDLETTVDAWDPRKWGIFAEEDHAFVMALSKMNIHELAIHFRRMADSDAGDIRQLAAKHSESDLDILKSYLGMLGDENVAKENHGWYYANLIAQPIVVRQDLLNHLDNKLADEDLRKLQADISHINRKIALVREIVRRWVKPEEFDYDRNAIARILERQGKVLAITRRAEGDIEQLDRLVYERKEPTELFAFGLVRKINAQTDVLIKLVFPDFQKILDVGENLTDGGPIADVVEILTESGSVRFAMTGGHLHLASSMLKYPIPLTEETWGKLRPVLQALIGRDLPAEIKAIENDLPQGELVIQDRWEGVIGMHMSFNTRAFDRRVAQEAQSLGLEMAYMAHHHPRTPDFNEVDQLPDKSERARRYAQRVVLSSTDIEGEVQTELRWSEIRTLGNAEDGLREWHAVTSAVYQIDSVRRWATRIRELVEAIIQLSQSASQEEIQKHLEPLCLTLREIIGDGKLYQFREFILHALGAEEYNKYNGRSPQEVKSARDLALWHLCAGNDGNILKGLYKALGAKAELTIPIVEQSL